MTTKAKTTEFGDGLRALAAMIDANPELAKESGLHWWFNYVNVPVSNKDHVAAFARAGLKAGAKVIKHQDDKWAGVNVTFGAVGLHVYIEREEICEATVVGVEKVTKKVKDPVLLAEVPEVEVTEEVEILKWTCKPILGDRDGELAEAVAS